MSDRLWAYGLTADEWLHLACEGQESEVSPCCGNISSIREMLMALATEQGDDYRRARRSMWHMLKEALDADGDGHGLNNAGTFPLLHRVIAGATAEDAAIREENERHWPGREARNREAGRG